MTGRLANRAPGRRSGQPAGDRLAAVAAWTTALERLIGHAGGEPVLPSLKTIAFNRLAFGPRPGDLAAFDGLGASDDVRLQIWVDSQLNPNAIADTTCDARLAAANLTTLSKNLPQLWADHYRGNLGRTQPADDVFAATWLRAVYSKRQLFEVLADFWHNHFSVYAWDYAYASATWAQYDRDVIRGHALGNFRQMLESVATSPAMLYYLDNYINQRAGNNENWAREMCELHTMGADFYYGVQNPTTVPKVDGVAVAYVDNDVYEASRCFTGWRVNDGYDDAPGDDGTFLYHHPWHDEYSKTFLGVFMPAYAADQADGNQILDLLAAHPGTAQHVCFKLCRRLVGDTPSQPLVDAAAAVFLAKKNDADQLKQVVRTICLSTEFKATWGQKIKRPFEAVAGFLRATEADFTPTKDFEYYYNQAGQTLFGRRSPDGYPDRKENWSNTNSLLQRWRLFNTIVQGTIDQTTVDLLPKMPGGLTSANAIADFWINRLLGRPMDSTADRDAVADFMAQGFGPNSALPAEQIASRLPHMGALILMSPEFQWR